jgi:hypothetical protein
VKQLHVTVSGWANLEQAAERGEGLWALDIDGDGWPWRAHRVVEVETSHAGWPTYYRVACGDRLSVHFHGCWGVKIGDLPLQDHAVHCQ